MIQLNHTYAGIPIEVEKDGEPIEADALPTAILFRNGSASAVTVNITTTAETGLYLAAFTTLGAGDGWAKTDRLFVRATAVIDGTSYKATIWNSFSEVDAPMRGTDGANTVTPTNLSAAQVRTELAMELARIDANISSRSTFAGGAVASVTDPVTVGTNNDKTGYALTQSFPSNFASLGITGDGYVSRVVLVDTTTANSDMVSEPLDSTETQASTAAAITAAELATLAKQDEILGAIDNISVELSSEDIEEISDTVSTAVSEEVEREGGMLQRLLSKFDGIDKLIRWIRQ